MNELEKSKGTQMNDDINPHKLYKMLVKDNYATEKLGDGMSVTPVVDYFGFKQLHYLIDEKNKTAVEFMSVNGQLLTVTSEDIDWDRLYWQSEEVKNRAKNLSVIFSLNIRSFKGGMGLVEWQLEVDGSYYMDEDGFGMTSDEEFFLYGYIDRTGKPLVKFQPVGKDYRLLNGMAKEARKVLQSRGIKTDRYAH